MIRINRKIIKKSAGGMKKTLVTVGIATTLAAPPVIGGSAVGTPQASVVAYTPAPLTVSYHPTQHMSFPAYQVPIQTVGIVSVEDGTSGCHVSGVSGTYASQFVQMDSASCEYDYFIINAEPNMAYTATIPNSIQLTNGTDSLTLTLTSSRLSDTVSGNGTAGIYIGGSITYDNTDGTLSSGLYTGSYTIDVAYD